MSDSILANVDMVLAISEDTINYQFLQLFDRGVIENEWKLLVRNATEKSSLVLVTQDNSDFDTKLSTWISTQSNIANLLIEKKYEQFGQMLGESTDELWDYGWSGTIAAPTITILSKDTQSLMFNVKFNSGSKLYSGLQHTKAVSIFDLSEAIYAFKVPIGRFEITSTKELLTPESQKQAATIISDTGLGESDFSMESLFLDFENADIANFDSEKSSFPKLSSSAIKTLQITILDYFKQVVAKQKHPYVLGYGMSLKTIDKKKDNQKALFLPTSLRFSTSYSKTKGESALNFLMMVGNTDFPSGQTVGVLPKSLLESKSYDNKNSSLDGVFAIDYQLFQKTIISPLTDKIGVGADIPSKAKYVSTKVQSSGKAQQWSTSAQISYMLESIQHWVGAHAFVNYSMDFSFDLMNDASNGLLWKGNLTSSINVKITESSLPHKNDPALYETWLSTSGDYKKGPSGNLGQIGTIKMSIKPGTTGHLIFSNPQITRPEFGLTKKPITMDMLSLGIFGGLSPIESDSSSGAATATELAQNTFKSAKNAVTNAKSSIDDALDKMFKIKIILPLGQLYTFSNIQLYSNRNTDNNPVTLNVSYVPVST